MNKVTETKGFLKVVEILTKSNIPAEECTHITDLIVELAKEKEELKKLLQSKKQELDGFATTIAKYLELDEPESSTYDKIINKIVRLKSLKQALIDIREYINKQIEFNNSQIQEYKTCIETNENGKFNDEEKDNMEHSMTINICINYKMKDILQIIDKVLGGNNE